MNIQEFCIYYGSNPRKAANVVREWRTEQTDTLFKILKAPYDQVIGGSVIAADALTGDGMRDQIPDELRDAFENLMKEKADTYAKMRQILLEKIRTSEGQFLSLEDPHVRGFISKLKGQIGENIFQQHAGSGAHLAPSSCQEGWDIVVEKPDGIHQYVQVKLYSNPSAVVAKMKEVHEKTPELEGWNGRVVDHVDFAVPENIADQVRELSQLDPELHDMAILSIPISADGAADIVKEGLNNVGPGELANFFDELLGGAIAAGSLHALANGFLWYKGAKEFSDAFADAAASTAVSTIGVGLGLMAETFFDAVALSGGLGIASRLLLGRMARARWSFADYLEQSIDALQGNADALSRPVQA